MKEREFNATLKSLSNKKGLLDKDKMKAATPEIKRQLTETIVRRRLPVVIELIPPEILEWLQCMGYFYQKQGKLYTFLCTCENMGKVT